MYILKIERTLAKWIHIFYCTEVKSSEINYKRLSQEYLKNLAAVHWGLFNALLEGEGNICSPFSFLKVILNVILLHTVQSSNPTMQRHGCCCGLGTDVSSQARPNQRSPNASQDPC